MNRLSKAINGHDPVNITTTIQEVRIQSIISYLLCNVGQEMDVDILNQLLSRLPTWYEENRKYNGDYVKIMSLANLDNLKIILDHPTFAPPPIVDRYVNTSTPQSFQVMMASDKIGTSSDTIGWLLQHNHPDKIKAYLASGKVIIPTPEQLAKMANCYASHQYSLSLVLADPRFDVSKLDTKLLKAYVDTNATVILDVLKIRLPDKINPLIAKKEEQTRMQELHRPNLFV